MAVASSNSNTEFCVSETHTQRNGAKQMVGTTEEDDCSFVWDEKSRLYFHARFSLILNLDFSVCHKVTNYHSGFFVG